MLPESRPMEPVVFRRSSTKAAMTLVACAMLLALSVVLVLNARSEVEAFGGARVALSRPAAGLWAMLGLFGLGALGSAIWWRRTRRVLVIDAQGVRDEGAPAARIAWREVADVAAGARGQEI